MSISKVSLPLKEGLRGVVRRLFVAFLLGFHFDFI